MFLTSPLIEQAITLTPARRSPTTIPTQPLDIPGPGWGCSIFPSMRITPSNDGRRDRRQSTLKRHIIVTK